MSSITRNAKLTVIQVAVTGVIIFFLYRYLIIRLGVEAVGVWSVVMALVTVGRVADFGLSTALTRFVARECAAGDAMRAAAYVQMAAAWIAVLYLVLGAGLLVAGYLVLPAIVPGHVAEARALLPWAAGGFLLGGIATVFQGALDGLQRVDLRSMLVMLGSVVFLGIAMVEVPHAGILALGYAQVVQALVLLAGGAGLVLWHLPEMRRPSRRAGVVPDLLKLGMPLQAISLSMLLFEPATKLLLSRFGTLSAVGYYEMASRMIQQFRALAVGGNQVLVPAIADAGHSNPARADRLYGEAYRIALYLAMALCGGILALAPLISELWLGQYVPSFVLFACLLAVGWCINIVAGPAYYSAVGAGSVRANVIGHVILSVVNLVAGVLLGMAFGSIGVVAGASLGLVAGSLTTIVLYHRGRGLDPCLLLPREDARFLCMTLMASLLGLAAYFGLRPHVGVAMMIPVTVLAFLAVVGASGWRHSARQRLTEALARRGEPR